MMIVVVDYNNIYIVRYYYYVLLMDGNKMLIDHMEIFVEDMLL
jgi:hypothetical protein